MITCHVLCWLIVDGRNGHTNKMQWASLEFPNILMGTRSPANAMLQRTISLRPLTPFSILKISRLLLKMPEDDRGNLHFGEYTYKTKLRVSKDPCLPLLVFVSIVAIQHNITHVPALCCTPSTVALPLPTGYPWQVSNSMSWHWDFSTATMAPLSPLAVPLEEAALAMPLLAETIAPLEAALSPLAVPLEALMDPLLEAWAFCGFAVHFVQLFWCRTYEQCLATKWIVSVRQKFLPCGRSIRRPIDP